MTHPTDMELCLLVEAVLGRLPEKDAAFAASLIRNIRRYGSATPKQRYWLEDLLARAKKADQQGERRKTQLGEFRGVMELFDKAKQHLKAPAIVIAIGSVEIRLSVACPSARVPGSINVLSNRGQADRDWFGRILQSGEFEASPRMETPPWLIDGLKRFSADPAGVAAAHGRLTGKCCFCNSRLTDERSTAAGYGKTCAAHYGLPWGDKPHDDLFAA